jgi:hypothetical protein
MVEDTTVIVAIGMSTIEKGGIASLIVATPGQTTGVAKGAVVDLHHLPRGVDLTLRRLPGALDHQRPPAENETKISFFGRTCSHCKYDILPSKEYFSM